MTTTTELIKAQIEQRDADIAQQRQTIQALDQQREQAIAALNGLVGARNQLQFLLSQQPEQTNELPDPQLPTGRKRGSRA